VLSGFGPVVADRATWRPGPAVLGPILRCGRLWLLGRRWPVGVGVGGCIRVCNGRGGRSRHRRPRHPGTSALTSAMALPFVRGACRGSVPARQIYAWGTWPCSIGTGRRHKRAAPFTPLFPREGVGGGAGEVQRGVTAFAATCAICARVQAVPVAAGDGSAAGRIRSLATGSAQLRPGAAPASR
jgi:hypothetical protein